MHSGELRQLMADSHLLICAAGSTFSQWGGFLGEPILLHHPDHFSYRCRPEAVGQRVFEGAVQPGEPGQWPASLRDGIMKLRAD